MKEKIKKYWLEIILLTVAFLIAIVSIILYSIDPQEITNEQVNFEKQNNNNDLSQYIYIDLSGEVVKPNLYRVKSGTRLKELIDLSGGLTINADRSFFNINYNLARILNDQEKIYIPSIVEIDSGLFTINDQLVNYLPVKEESEQNTATININDTTIDELDTLPGIGIVTANKIINNQPYQNVEDLLNKKILNKNVYEEIKKLVSVN